MKHIFNADARFVRQIDAGLHRGITLPVGTHLRCGARRYIPRVFPAHAVPQGSGNIPPYPPLPVHRRPWCTSLQARRRAAPEYLPAARGHQVISRLHFCRGAAHGHCYWSYPNGNWPRYEWRQVKQHKVALLLPDSRHAMGHGGMGASWRWSPTDAVRAAAPCNDGQTGQPVPFRFAGPYIVEQL